MNPGQNLLSHEFINLLILAATRPQRLVLGGVVVIERVNHLANLMEAIHEKKRRFLACVVDQLHDLLETCFCHVFVQAKRGAIKHVNSLHQPPEILIIYAKEARHEEDAPQPSVKLLEVHGLAQSLVGL